MARTGVRTLGPGTPGAVEPTDWQELCTVDGDALPMRAKVLSLRVTSTQPDASNLPRNANVGDMLAAGAWWDGWLSHRDHGVVRITTWGEGGERTILADLRGGDYQLPPCGAVRVEVARYFQPAELPADPVLPDYEVRGTLIDGITSDVSPLLFTCSQWWGAAAGDGEGGGPPDRTLRPPLGAYAFELLPVIGDSFSEGSHGVFRDRAPESGVHLPPSSPIPLVYPQLVITDNNGTTGTCAVVFFVR